MPTPQLILIQTTTPDKTYAQTLATHLITQKLAACVQISGPIDSHYTWQNKPEISQEFSLHIKTKETLFSQVEKTILETHPYDTPEITATPIIHVSQPYKDWLYKNTI